MKNTINITLILVSLFILGIRVYKGIDFKRNVTGYIKRAADANTISLANEELSKAINYLEAHDLTEGYTSILYETPDEDISFWYRNLKASQNELQNLKSESALERTNVLIKLRETLMESGKKAKVTAPKGISVYPHNKFWAVIVLIAVIIGLTGLFRLITDLEKAQKETDTNK